MGSFKGDKRKPGRNRPRPSGGTARRDLAPERLEERTLLSTAIVSTPQFVTDMAINSAVYDKGGMHLAELFESNQRRTQFPDAFQQTFQSKSSFIEFRNGKVGVDLYSNGLQDFAQLTDALRGLQMDVTATDANNRIIEGYVPIDQLSSISQFGSIRTIRPIFTPGVRSQGAASNQANEVLRADAARAQFGIDGSGITVGVLSDSADRFQGGLADSIGTGDLPPLERIQILLDEAVGGNNSDEGRAMMELIYDIAPGADLAFHTAFGGVLTFAQGVRDLSRVAGAEVIVDDVGYANEPVFQPGLVAQAVTDVVVNDGATYFSAAGNDADKGIETNFRGVNATVAGVGDGRFLDFDPGPGVATTLQVTTNEANAQVVMWWDDPWFTGTAATNLDFFLLDANGAIVAQGIDNNIGSDTPQEFTAVPAAGTYQLAIRVTDGPDPNRVRWQSFFSDLDVSQQFGNGDSTTYPTSFAHPAHPETIGVAAVNYFDAPPFSNQTPTPTADFTSTGPAFYFFTPDGQRLPQRQLLLKPDVAGPQGTNTTFFSPGVDVEPDGFPNFFGTSAAAPNVAAVAALMKQLNPSSTPTDIRDAMVSTATQLNGVGTGSWDPRGGFGLVDAVRAMTAVDQLRIVASTPADVETLNSAPSFIDLTFSKPVNPATVQASDLSFPVAPPGVAVEVQNPIVLGPNTVRFPIVINVLNPDTEVNGTYAFQLNDDAIQAQDGSQLVGLQRAFFIQDAVAPRVANTILAGRIIVVQFDEAMRGSTISKDTIQLVRTGPSGQFNQPDNVIVTNDLRATLFYDAENNRAIYDLRGIPQSALPSDTYALVVTDTVRDAAGNQLDGNFTGVFPSGDGVAGGVFAQLLGTRQVLAPQIVTFGLAPGSDTGIPGDQNTNQTLPTFTGFVSAQFPSTNAGLQVAVQFIQDRNDFDLNTGVGGLGFTGTPDLIVNTDASGFFSFQAPESLREGFHRVRIVVVGEVENPPLPGQASLQDLSFRVDLTNPLVTASSIPSESRIDNLRDITLNFSDPVNPQDLNDPLAVPAQLDFPGLDPGTATNLSNYSLISLGPDRVLGTGDDVDLSGFIQNAIYTSTTQRTLSNEPYTSRVELTFSDGLPSGRYVLVARTQEGAFSGIRDAAGNPLDNNPAQPGNQSFASFFELQPEPSFINGFRAYSRSAIAPGTVTASGPREFYEIPVPGFTPRAEAPPELFHIDFSSTLAPRDYSDAVQLLRSGNSPGATPDGDFGLDGATGFTRVPGVTVTLVDSIPGSTIGQPGFRNRLEVRIPSGTVLPADTYRLVIPNTGDEEIRDIFGNQADLEFLGNESPTTDNFEVFMPDGTYRDGLTGDGVGGGSFVTGFVVVPGQRIGSDGRIRGNIIYVRPDAQDDPFITSDDPDGSLARPFLTLLPEARANQLNNGDLNSAANFGTGFDPRLDRNSNGRFDRSAFFEAEQNSGAGPVVVVALPGIVRQVPGTFNTTQDTFVIAPPAGVDPTRPENNASGSVPAMTTMVFNPGSTLKLFNASLYVQNQGSALQLRGGAGPNEQVTFTSLLDDSVGGDSNRDGTSTSAGGGNWGGVVFRNYDDVSNGRGALAPQFPVDGKLGLSGASDVLSIINHARLRFGGGAVPQTIGQGVDMVTLFNSRPTITNTLVADGGATQAAISADVDSLREDAIARGPLIRRLDLVNNSINGVLIRPQGGAVSARETDAMFYPDNPSNLGAARNFVIDDPVAYVLASQLVIGERSLLNTGGQTNPNVSSRLYVQPGMMVKSRTGASIAVVNINSSINFGDRTYISQFDTNPNLSPEDPTFAPSTGGDAKPLFTSLFDDAAETFFFDQATGVRRVIVPAGATDNDPNNPAPSPGNIPRALRWGNLSITPGARAVIDEVEFRYGGGQIVTPEGILPNKQVLDLTNQIAGFLGYPPAPANVGSRVMITDNDFNDNFDTPILVEPNQLLAADPLRPLTSGNPFFRGNVLERNSINGLGISTGGIVIPPPGFEGDFYAESVPANGNFPNLTVDSVWSNTDIVHVLRGTIILAGWGNGAGQKPVASSTELLPELEPAISLTIQSALPDSLLPDGSRIARPGEEMVVKLFNDTLIGNPGPGDAIDPDLDSQTASVTLNLFGAGFNVGYDDGADPDAPSPVIDPGYGSQLRIVGIGANETTGQQRVPVTITSLRDNTAGPVVRGIDQSDTWYADFRGRDIAGGLDTPQPGDGGMIAFGGGSLFDYNLFDNRNGSLIDNADIRFLHRIEFQGGGLVDAFIIDPDRDEINEDDIPVLQRFGINPLTFSQDPSLQYNAPHGWTVSNSNLSTFRDAGIFADQGFDLIARSPLGGGGARIGGLRGQATNLFLVNNTIANMPVGVRVNATTGNNDTQQTPAQIALLHNTFYNNGVALRTQAPVYSNGPPPNSLSHVYFIGMNNIFDGGSVGSQEGAAAVRTDGMIGASELLFNVFHNYTTNLDITNPAIAGLGFRGNNGAIFGDPLFLDPENGDFFIQSGSSAIDAAISELGPTTIGDMLFPISDQLLDSRGGIRNFVGRTNQSGSFGSPGPQAGGKVISLPGSPGRSFFDQFVASIPGSEGSALGPASNAATFAYTPIGGVRDKDGFLRIDDPNTPSIGFGGFPFYDIGAREFRIFDPPSVTTEGALDVNGDGAGDAVFATIVDPNTGSPSDVNLYAAGSIAGTNRAPQSITIQFDKQLDPATITSETVLLQASGGDGIFGNANSPSDRFIPLSGRLAFDPQTRRMTIRLAQDNLLLTNDLYQIILVGSGGNVIRDAQGNALDGENTGPGNLPRPLPSGDGFPGGNFVLPFTIDTRPPNINPGTLRLQPSSDPGFPGQAITNTNPPSFVGSINDLFPPVNPLVDQRVVLDVDSNGDGIFDLIGVGQGITDAQGNFVVTPSQPLPETPFNVGPDGILGTADDSGYSVARIRVFDVAGNESDPNDPNAFLPFVVDTTAPQVLATTPETGSLAGSGSFTVSVTVNENLLLGPMLNGGITAFGAGPDGLFGTGDDRAATVDVSNLTYEFLGTAPSGPVRVTFDVLGANVNDIYRVNFGPTVTDRAGNAIGGNGFSLDVIVFSPGTEEIFFVDDDGGFGGGNGSRANPFRTIAEAIAQATVGDTVAVLPGAYNEAITLKSLVRVVSASPTSTDGNVVAGSAQSTIIRAPLNPSGPEVTVRGTDLIGLGGDVDTELRGFTIASPLSGVSVGQIQPDSIGLQLVNSGGLFHRNLIINGSRGIDVSPRAAGANPRIESNVISGNLTGVVIMDTDNTGAVQPVRVANNTFALNNGGMVVADETPNSDVPIVADVVNNIFWQNNTRETGAEDVHMSVFPPVAQVRGNMFGSDPNDVFLGFDVNSIGSTPTAASAFNFIGEPDFAAARDPRPQFDGPTVFLLDGNFGLTSTSDAIDAAINQAAPTLDFLGRPRVDIASVTIPDVGPADVGAYEFQSGQGGPNIPGFPGSPGFPGFPDGGTPTTPPGAILFGAGNPGSAEPGSPQLVGSNPPSVTFEPGAGVGRAAQTASPLQATAGQARRDREALRSLLAGKKTEVTEVAPQGRRAWLDLIAKTRFRRGI